LLGVKLREANLAHYLDFLLMAVHIYFQLAKKEQFQTISGIQHTNRKTSYATFK